MLEDNMCHFCINISMSWLLGQFSEAEYELISSVYSQPAGNCSTRNKGIVCSVSCVQYCFHRLIVGSRYHTDYQQVKDKERVLPRLC